MASVGVVWTKDPKASGIAYYDVIFQVTPNGSSTPNAALTLKVNESASLDTSGYSADYRNIAGTSDLNPGDSTVVTLKSVDTFGQSSPIITASGSPVVIPAPPPPPPPTGPVNPVASVSTL